MGTGLGVWLFQYVPPSPPPYYRPPLLCITTHAVCVCVFADTIPLVLLRKELILDRPRTALPLFAPQSEKIINSELESKFFFPVVVRTSKLRLCSSVVKNGREKVFLMKKKVRICSSQSKFGLQWNTNTQNAKTKTLCHF